MKKRFLFSKFESDRSVLKAIAKNQVLPSSIRELAWDKLSSMPRDSSITRIRQTCRITGRTGGIIKNFGVSRLVFRELAERGELPGVRKASW